MGISSYHKVSVNWIESAQLLGCTRVNNKVLVKHQEMRKEYFFLLPEICLLKVLSQVDMGLSKSAHQFLKNGSLKKSSLTTVAT